MLSEVALRIKTLRTQAALYPDAHVDCATVRETVALLQSLLPVYPAADKQAQVDMAAEHNARADREAIERARVVGVLDAWALAKPDREHRIRSFRMSPFCYLIFERNGERRELGFPGHNSDAARAAAAKAIAAGEV